MAGHFIADDSFPERLIILWFAEPRSPIEAEELNRFGADKQSFDLQKKHVAPDGSRTQNFAQGKIKFCIHRVIHRVINTSCPRMRYVVGIQLRVNLVDKQCGRKYSFAVERFYLC